MSIDYFNYVRARLTQYFVDSTVIEYVPHAQCRKIAYLFERTPYTVINPDTNDLSSVHDNATRVSISIDRFHRTPNYLEEFKAIHRVSNKLIMFSCAAAGAAPERGYWKNLTEGDFYGNLDMDAMFDTHKFFPDYDTNTLFFWGIKR